ncbi:MAG: protein translocase subunit SecD [Actinomycetota bacterium]|nr:protein translocase subunit SecD [Actinomycetota bacterium]
MRKQLIISLVGIMLLAYGSMAVVLISGSGPALGLDLQGGISITQRPKDGTPYSDESLDLAVEKIRERVDSLGVAEPEILRQGNTIVVNLPGVKNQRQAEELVQVTGQVYLRPVLQCQAIDPPSADTTTSAGGSTTSGPSTSGPTTTAAGGPSRPASGDTTTTPDTTVDGATTTAPVSPEPASATTTPGATTTTVASGPTTTVDVPLDQNGFPLQQSDPTTQQFLPLKGDDSVYCLVGPAQGTGEVFSDNASAVVLPTGWGVTVDLREGPEGEGVFNAVAAECNQLAESCPTGQLAIELDGTIQSAPSMNAASYSGGVEISGDFTPDEARNLARVINSGSLPVQLQLESVQTVSPTLGSDSLRAAWISGLFGVFLVLVFMVLYYKALGFIVAVGITISMSLLWSVVTLLSKTQGLALSLSGIAGIIVSVGVTVDSYVVFFERLKDEVRSGKTLRNSAQRGFTGAWHTIVLADVVSLIGALVLWYLTVGAVRGFAFFLALSTACDLFVSYFFTRPAVLLLARTKWMERRKVMGIEVAHAGGVA